MHVIGAGFGRTGTDSLKKALDMLQMTENPNAINRRIIAEGVMGGQPDDRDHAIATYEAHNKEVRAVVPRERLIDLELGAGWEPLCSGLELPIPIDPYPHGNTAESFSADGTET